MVDNLKKDQRSKIMSRIRSKNTKPEMIVRKRLHSLGYRYRLHKKELPGKPDIFLKKFNLAIFVNGCFWHLHGCKKSKYPETNINFWKKKLKRNSQKDREAYSELEKMNINKYILWECSLEEDLKSLTLYLKSDQNNEKKK